MAKTFHLNPKELEIRHNLAVNTYELGKFTFTEYLNRVFFHEKRLFTAVQFRSFIFAQSKPCSEMIELAHKLRAKYGLTQ